MGLGRWLRDHPRTLERAYKVTHKMFQGLDPVISNLGYERAEVLLRRPEEWLKSLVFDCRMCGMCVLHSTGMTCPMSCPKNLRNGPCGGVRINGHCEVKPEMRCVWVEAFERSVTMSLYGEEIRWVQPPVDNTLKDRSAWITMLTGEDVEYPKCWPAPSDLVTLSQPHD